MTFADLPAGTAVFVDANTLTYYFQPHPVFGPACDQLVRQIEQGQLLGFTSTHALSEVSHRLGYPEIGSIPMNRSFVLLPCLFLIGCSAGDPDDPSRKELPPSAPPPKVERLKDLPLADRIKRLKEIQQATKSVLTPLLEHPTWTGDRLRVVGIRGEFPVTQSTGPWKIELVPSTTKNVVELRGMLFAKHLSVRLNLDRDSLLINGQEFQGRTLSGNSPMAQGAAFKGVSFTRDEGSIDGKAAILLLEDGRAAMDFDKVFIGLGRAREYGILSGKGQ